MTGAGLVRADALHIPLRDESVDLIVSSPPYFALRDYQDDDGSVDGQLGAEKHPYEFLDALEAWTVECLRVMKPTASLFVNLGDKRSGSGGHNNAGISRNGGPGSTLDSKGYHQAMNETASRRSGPNRYNQSAIATPDGAPIMRTSLLGLPWRYALRCVDNLGMGLVSEIIWAKRSAMPESVTRRVHGRHEHLFHLVKSPAFHAFGDEIREPSIASTATSSDTATTSHSNDLNSHRSLRRDPSLFNPLGRMPGSFWLIDDDCDEGPVWELSAEPFKPPPGLGEHFAAFPSEIPRRCILGWTTSGYCTVCDEPRRPVVDRTAMVWTPSKSNGQRTAPGTHRKATSGTMHSPPSSSITSYTCACPDISAPTRPAVVLDPFVGTGTTVMAAEALGRTGIGIDLSTAFLRIADWRISHPEQRSRVRERSNLEAQGSLL